MKQSLIEIWHDLNKQGKGSDKNTVHSYLPVYEQILSPYRETAKNVLEIGLFNGHSLLMWEKYFAGTVYGIDCSDQPHGGLADLRPLIEEGSHHISIFDAENKSEVYGRFCDVKFDVIIEDAGHEVNQQLNLYKVWKPYLSENGIYIIEDVQAIDAHRHLFENIDTEKTVIIIDNRQVSLRYDDVLVIIK